MWCTLIEFLMFWNVICHGIYMNCFYQSWLGCHLGWSSYSIQMLCWWIVLFGLADTGMQLKRDSAATGSWSIQDEIRRVRSRATEELLRSLPSSKIDWSAFAMENKNNVNSSAIENIGASLGERVHNSTNLVDASANLARGLGSQVSPGMILLL